MRIGYNETRSIAAVRLATVIECGGYEKKKCVGGGRKKEENEGKPSLYSELRATQLTHSLGYTIEDFAAPGQTLLLPPRVFV